MLAHRYVWSYPPLPRRRSLHPTLPAARPSRSPLRLPATPVDIAVPGSVAQLLPDGSAAAPADAPPQVQQAIWAANKIQDKPYIYGGGHGEFEDDGYDCSGTVSYALHGGGLLDTPLDSASFMAGARPARASGSRSTRTRATPTP